MTRAQLSAILRRLRSIAAKSRPALRAVVFKFGRPHEFPKPRDFAYCTQIGKQIRIYMNPTMPRQSRSRVEGLMMHELGHAFWVDCHREQHSEQDADNAAEVMFGKKVYYDDMDVQTSKAIKNGVKNQYPRPSHLRR